VQKLRRYTAFVWRSLQRLRANASPVVVWVAQW